MPIRITILPTRSPHGLSPLVAQTVFITDHTEWNQNARIPTRRTELPHRSPTINRSTVYPAQSLVPHLELVHHGVATQAFYSNLRIRIPHRTVQEHSPGVLGRANSQKRPHRATPEVHDERTWPQHVPHVNTASGHTLLPAERA